MKKRFHDGIILVFTSYATGGWGMEIRSGTELSSLSRELLESAREPEFVDWLKRTRRRIHQYPELGFEEYKTSQVIRSELDSLGIEYTWPVAKTGVVASVGSGLQPWFGLRADMDALPIQYLLTNWLNLHLLNFHLPPTTGHIHEHNHHVENGGGSDIALSSKPKDISDEDWEYVNRQACGTIRLCLAKDQKYFVMKETMASSL
ncbi:hypothetical protein LWI29_005327 [Acer saccharum]|uniref:Uncharacterized protein n=1 Tax=Acer saccharum TaxID=4024 RepID=A0AA39RXN8_ACESA|nr:hypothetical protein LWI29_005327 [Acer saccharum]